MVTKTQILKKLLVLMVFSPIELASTGLYKSEGSCSDSEKARNPKIVADFGRCVNFHLFWLFSEVIITQYSSSACGMSARKRS